MAHFNWTPGIGDPSIGGWLTVLLYLAAAFSCWRTAHSLTKEGADAAREPHAWRSISLLFVALGINKQLDLQTALTEVGRIIAQYQGWYDKRQTVQLVFILLIACIITAMILLCWVRNSLFPTWMALIGATIVLGFVLMRAASFHHIDRFIGTSMLGLRWNWILEMTGIVIVLFASWWRRHAVKHRRPA